MIEKKLGRGSENDIKISGDMSVSGNHCSIRMEDDGSFSLTDFSRNGTYINGRKIPSKVSVPLKEKDNIRVGRTLVPSRLWRQYFPATVPIIDPQSPPQPPRPEEPIEQTPPNKGLEPTSESIQEEPIQEPTPPVDTSTFRPINFKEVEEMVARALNRLHGVVSSFDGSSMNNYKSRVTEASVHSRRYKENIVDFGGVLSELSSIFVVLERQHADNHECANVEMYVRRSNPSFSKDSDLQGKIAVEHEKLRGLSDRVCRQITDYWEILNRNYTRYFDNYTETMPARDAVFTEKCRKAPSLTCMVGYEKLTARILEKTLSFSGRSFFDMFSEKHLVVRYDRMTKQKAIDSVTNILARVLAVIPSGNVKISMIDAEEMDGVCQEFKRLNRSVYSLLCRYDEIRACLDTTERHIENIIRNLLHHPIGNLRDYNAVREEQEPYHILVIEDFPSGMTQESMLLLKSILKNGIRAGVQVILLQNQDVLDSSEEDRKRFSSLGMECMSEVFDLYDFVEEEHRLEVEVEVWNDRKLHDVVQLVNLGFEERKEMSLNLLDYIPEETEWWKRKSSQYMEIPFGLSPDRQIRSLKISQENGQNSALVIGIPGSGKSVFLHALICHAAINYSPDELGLYLIDFSGVEFNPYALHRLPHAKVIAPEAEREFGLSVLTELVEEGRRRMILCRENNVNSVAELREQRPELKIPRLLVVIDEFQKLFEADKDSSSRAMAVDAVQKIQNIIQEYRKFGINLILATQRLQSVSGLPKNLIANRVVFNSEPNDFASLITWPSGVPKPLLSTGKCVYNAESGGSHANIEVKGFNVPKADMERILNRLESFSGAQGRKSNTDLLVFRGDELPDFKHRRVLSRHLQKEERPEAVGVYLGEAIAIQDTDVCVELRREFNNNVLIVGGVPEVAEKIAYYGETSLISCHPDHSAGFVTFNFLRSTNPLFEEISGVFEALQNTFDSKVVTSQAEVLENLKQLKELIEKRQGDSSGSYENHYLTFYGFQFARMFDSDGFKQTEAAKLLSFILTNGPVVGVFTLLQVDNLANLSKVSGALSCFNYRVVLQMTEADSYKVMDSSLGSKLQELNRPSSKYRAYCRDNSFNITTKFKPYK